MYTSCWRLEVHDISTLYSDFLLIPGLTTVLSRFRISLNILAMSLCINVLVATLIYTRVWNKLGFRGVRISLFAGPNVQCNLPVGNTCVSLWIWKKAGFPCRLYTRTFWPPCVCIFMTVISSLLGISWERWSGVKLGNCAPISERNFFLKIKEVKGW